ncbi:MAG: hypothetical protein OSB42_13095 [Planctomycetota bacterium]|nr:hypothetical protein [Planctomycetota bacterium]
MGEQSNKLEVRPLEPQHIAQVLGWYSMRKGTVMEWLLLDGARPVHSLVACEGETVRALLPVLRLGDPIPGERPPMWEWGQPLVAPGSDAGAARGWVETLAAAFLRGQDDPEGVVLTWNDTRDPVPFDGFERLGSWSMLQGLPTGAEDGAWVMREALPLDDAAAAFIGACAGASAWVPRRSSAYLDWRYGRAPGGGHETTGVLEGGELRALAVTGPPRWEDQPEECLGDGPSTHVPCRVLPVYEFWVAEGACRPGQALLGNLAGQARAQACELNLALPSWQPAFDLCVGMGMRVTPTSRDLYARPAALAPSGPRASQAWNSRALDLEALRCAWPWSLGDAHFSWCPFESSGPAD